MEHRRQQHESSKANCTFSPTLVANKSRASPVRASREALGARAVASSDSRQSRFDRLYNSAAATKKKLEEKRRQAEAACTFEPQTNAKRKRALSAPRRRRNAEDSADSVEKKSSGETESSRRRAPSPAAERLYSYATVYRCPSASSHLAYGCSMISTYFLMSVRLVRKSRTNGRNKRPGKCRRQPLK